MGPSNFAGRELMETTLLLLGICSNFPSLQILITISQKHIENNNKLHSVKWLSLGRLPSRRNCAKAGMELLACLIFQIFNPCQHGKKKH